MRQVADRLGVHAGSLYYHVKNKEALFALLADRVASEAYGAGTAALTALGSEAAWSEQALAQMSALRATTRAHRGGAVLLASSPRTLSPGALSLMERLLQTLQRAGVPAEHAIVAADTLLSHVTGFVLQEQSEQLGMGAADLAERFPLVVAGAGRYDADALFSRSVQLICTAIAAFQDVRTGARSPREWRVGHSPSDASRAPGLSDGVLRPE
jgi:TetR/AcrR family tetracycline transcriptional repressor